MRRNASPIVVVASLLSLLIIFVSVRAAPQAALGQPPVVITLVSQPRTDGYVGEDRCRACHRAEVTQFRKTAHAELSDAKSGQHMDCESCHGSGNAHADAEEAARGNDAATDAANKLIFAFRAAPAENTARCQTCHTSARSQQGFAHSPHSGVGLSCNSCHSPHLVEAAYKDRLQKPPLPQQQLFQVPVVELDRRWLANSQLKDSQPGLCYTCHAQIRAQFSQPFHHKVPEGAIKCTDCHNPHGTENHATLASPGWETCTTCHTDKHGPFLFEHAAVKVEGCAVCHSPHGAASRFLLNRRESRFLCLQCHGDPHSAQDQVSVPHSRFGFQTRGDCTRCHVAIHGSNFNPAFLQ